VFINRASCGSSNPIITYSITIAITTGLKLHSKYPVEIEGIQFSVYQ